jgi:hypothetical protein
MAAAARRSGVRSKGVLPVETTILGRSKIRAGRGAGDAEADALAPVDDTESRLASPLADLVTGLGQDRGRSRTLVSLKYFLKRLERN